MILLSKLCSSKFNEKLRSSRLQNFLTNDWKKTREEGKVIKIIWNKVSKWNLLWFPQGTLIFKKFCTTPAQKQHLGCQGTISHGIICLESNSSIWGLLSSASFLLTPMLGGLWKGDLYYFKFPSSPLQLCLQFLGQLLCAFRTVKLVSLISALLLPMGLKMGENMPSFQE